MSCCSCNKILDFCSTPACSNGSLDLQIKAQLDGIYTLITDFLGAEVKIPQDFLIDDRIVFPTEGLNEEYTYLAKVYDPAGDQVVILKDAIEYDCFRFSTRQSYIL